MNIRILIALIFLPFLASAQTMKLTSNGKSLAIAIDDIILVRTSNTGGAIITYGTINQKVTVTETMTQVRTSSCSKLVSLSVYENISGVETTNTLLFNVLLVSEIRPTSDSKAIITLRTTPKTTYRSTGSYTSVANTFSACISGGGSGGLTTVVHDSTLTGNGTALSPLSVVDAGGFPDSIPNSALMPMPALTIKGNNTGSTGPVLDLTKVQVQSMLSVDDLIAMTGVAEGNTSLLNFSGSIIPNNSTIKAALQALETAIEVIGDTITVSDSPKINFTMLNRDITATLVPGGVALTDIASSGATNGQIIKFNGTNWVVSSDITGSSTDSSFFRVTGIGINGYSGKRQEQDIFKQGSIILGKNVLTNTAALDTSGVLVLNPRSSTEGGAQFAIKINSFSDPIISAGISNLEIQSNSLQVKPLGFTGIGMDFVESSRDKVEWGLSVLDDHYFGFNNITDSKTPFSISLAAPDNAMWIDGSGNVGVGNAMQLGRFNIEATTGATTSLLTLKNSTGTSRFFRSNATPEGAITGIVGDWAFSTTGLFAKITGAGNTGWGEYMNLKKSHGATTNQLLKWNGTTWVPANDEGLTYSGGIGISVVGLTINNDGVTSINGEIGDVTDYVKLTDPVGGTGGDVTGTIDLMTVIGLQGTPVDGTPPTLGQVLAYDGTNWIPTTGGGGGGGITNFTAAQGAAPAPAASSHDGETWRNDASGELWASDGSVWYPFSYGGKECQDTVLVSAITVQPGGSVTTGSPLVRSSLGVWEHLYNYATPNTIPDGVVTDVVSGPRAIIQYCGVRKGSGATPNSSYYVDQSANTGFTTTKPASNIRPLGKIASNGDFLVNAGLLFSKDNFPGIIKNGSLSGVGIVGDTLRISTGDKGDIDVTLNGLTWTVDTNAITTVKILDAAVTMAKIAQAGATTDQSIVWNGSAWAPTMIDGGIRRVTTISSALQDTISKYGFLASYVDASGVFFAASTTSASTLHSCYINGYSGGAVRVLGSGPLTITATYSYVVGQTYYLRDSGALAPSADSDGDAQDFDSSVCSVIASLGSNQYIIILKDPRHFTNN